MESVSKFEEKKKKNKRLKSLMEINNQKKTHLKK